MLRKIYRYFSGYDLFRIPAVSFVRAIEALRSSGLQYIDMDAAGDTVVLSVPFFTAQKIRMVFASEKIEFQEEMRGMPRIAPLSAPCRNSAWGAYPDNQLDRFIPLYLVF